jgi:hypothetical protein
VAFSPLATYRTLLSLSSNADKKVMARALFIKLALVSLVALWTTGHAEPVRVCCVLLSYIVERNVA